MFRFQKLKRLPLSCLVVLSVMKYAYADVTVLKSCATGDNKCDSLADGKYCLGSGKIYKYTQSDRSCTAQADGYYVFDKTTENTSVDLSSGTEGLLYSCTSGTCTQITTAGYYLIDISSAKYLLSCDSSTKVCTKTDPTADAYYLNGNGSNGTVATKLIKCIDTTVANCSEATPVKGAYYLNGSDYNSGFKSLIYCSAANACEKSTVATDGYYLNGDEYATKFTKLIKCDRSTFTEASSMSANSGYFLNGHGYDTTKKYTKLIKLDSSAYTEETPKIGYFVDGANFTTDKYTVLIKCTATDSCDTFTPTVVGFYGNGDGATTAKSVTTYKKLIDCSTNLAECTENAAPPDGHYVNSDTGTAGSPDTFTTVIKCTSGDCENVESPNDGFYLNGNGATGTQITYVNLIKCETDTNAKKCSEVVPAVTGTYLDGDNKANVITCDAAPVCTTGTGETKPGYGYIDASSKDDSGNFLNVIYCPSGECQSVVNGNAKTGTIDQNTGFLDAGATDPSVDIIICTTEKCATNSAFAGAEGYAILDGSSANEDGSKFTNLITYSSTNSKWVSLAETSKTPSVTVGYGYIDASDTTAHANIILCNTEDGCISSEGSTDDGTAYIDGSDDKNTITCPGGTCASAVGLDSGNSDTYINAVDLSQLIYCTSEKCNLYETEAKNGHSEFYPRVDSSVGFIIHCTYEDKKSKCVLETAASGTHDNTVYLNGFNKYEEYDAKTKLLIVCDATPECGPTVPTFVNTDINSIYYVNSDPANTEPLKEDLIECDKDKDGKVTCSIIKGDDKDVYLNANASATSKNIITCSKTDACQEVETDFSTTDPGYYVNAGAKSTDEPLSDTLIKCEATCDVLPADDGATYINSLDTSQTIQCYEDKGCKAVTSKATPSKNEVFLNSSDLDSSSNAPLVSDIIICSNGGDSGIVCEVKDGHVNDVYINSHNTSELIKCISTGCEIEESKATATKPEFYVNADPVNTTDGKLINDLIRCKKNGEKVTCEPYTGKNGDVYLNANAANESTKANVLITCTETGGCITAASAVADSKPPVYYVNAGSALSAKLNDTLIQCIYDATTPSCDIKIATLNEVYVNYASTKDELPLIKCVKNGCKVSASTATEESKEFYVNAGDIDDTPLKYDVIECSNESDTITCTEIEKSGLGVYLNSNYAESGDTNQLIQCTNDGGCLGIKAGKSNEYYVNAESTDLTNGIIFCSNKKCEKQTPESVPTYYVGKNGNVEDDLDGLIACVASEDTTSTRRKRGTVEKCSFKTAFTSSGYYLNAGYNKAINQTIICDSMEGCGTVKVDLGYYVNVGDEEKPIIVCEKEGVECEARASPSCPAEVEDANAGDYCYQDSQLKFYPNSNSTYVTATKSDDYYTFATIPANGFPGIKSETNSLFKVSYAFINRFYQSGIVMIDKNGKLIDSLSSADQNDITLYDCNDTTKMCTEKPKCTPNTYMYDSENKKAVFCNNGVLEYASITGYVVDGNRIVGSNHPYIIQCGSNGKCTSLKPKVASYFENSGYDSATNSLIQCSNNNCATVTAEIGYYVGHEGAGYIQCTSATACAYYPAKSKVKYVNAGFNKSTYAIISCTKSGGCVASKAKKGYYLTYVSTLLIQCTSPSSCTEYVPTVNYYFNADFSESSNTIINCVQNSQVVTCAVEATNTGCYMSSVSNVLICYKPGSGCNRITVKNGYYKSATKGLSSNNGSKRMEEEEEVTEKAREVIDDLEDEDGKSVHISRDSDDSYGIIRCVNGKCQALSPSELAAIPVCEFNNNKCYITLEYAMTKSATTSISAGNICTNIDRSIFYFATDTIVVKPNVISGVTATYIYTTTNSNCLEVNDSYTDMYFTVGSNIYTLDQGSVNQFYETGYYFINTAKNTLVPGNDIDGYNDENVKLYRCNGSSCSIADKPESMTYYADVNKRILKYNVNSGAYSFAYDKDITCIFANNKCTPNADLKNKEFCITYKGELVLAKSDIKNRETGECYRASSITSTIYGYSQYLYNMNLYAAQMVDETGYYIVSLSTNTTVVSKNYKTKNNGLVVYGCQLSSCKEYTPDEDTYYYDGRAKTILRYRDGIWGTPSTSGYAYISLNPADTYIYRFTKNLDEIKINSMANYGYYYTVDQEMYHCDEDEDGSCSPIKDTGYYFTNTGEVYYCVHDSEELEATECTKQACVSGQYYYIEDAYYRCESSSTLVPVMSRYCSYNENVIVNFPLALTEEYPDKIKQAIEGVEKNNNSTAVVSRRGKNYLESVSGIFTNCTYNVEETKSTFDLVCVNNYVKVDEETDDIKICSLEQMGYVECVESEENPEKCNVSAAYPLLKPTLFTSLILLLISLYYLL